MAALAAVVALKQTIPTREGLEFQGKVIQAATTLLQATLAPAVEADPRPTGPMQLLPNLVMVVLAQPAQSMAPVRVTQVVVEARPLVALAPLVTA